MNKQRDIEKIAKLLNKFHGEEDYCPNVSCKNCGVKTFCTEYAEAVYLQESGIGDMNEAAKDTGTHELAR